MWETGGGRKIQLPLEASNRWETVSISPDGNLLFAGKGREGSVWNVETGKKMSTLQNFEHYLGYAMFSPDGKRLAIKFEYTHGNSFDPEFNKKIYSLDPTNFPAVRIWNTETGEEVSTLKNYGSEFAVFQFLPNSKQLLASGFSTARLWDVETGQWIQKFDVGGTRIGAGHFAPDYKTYCGYSVGGLKIIDLSTTKVMATLKGHREQAVPSSFSPDGSRLLTSSTDGTAKLWDTKTGRELLSFKAAIGKHSHPMFSPDGKSVLILRNGAVDIMTAQE
jgi:WD40 repeat protein